MAMGTLSRLFAGAGLLEVLLGVAVTLGSLLLVLLVLFVVWVAGCSVGVVAGA